MTAKVSPSGTDGIKDHPHGSKDEQVIEGTELMSAVKYHKPSDEIEWIKKNIKMRNCAPCMLCEAKNNCQCDNGKQENPSSKRQQKELDQNNPVHTCTEPTNAFGDIKFDNYGGNVAKFVRVDSNTDEDIMLTLLRKVWLMPKPHLLISVAGGDQDFEMKSPFREACLRGLIKALQDTGAWIITDGIHTGVTKYIGKVVKEQRLISKHNDSIITIGITPWGTIQNKKQLVREKGSWPAEYYIEEQLNPEESLLDPNHSHFILVDNGTEHKDATHIGFRINIESIISKNIKIGTETGGINVPVVLLVLEWGKDTEKLLQNALDKKTPVVIVKIINYAGIKTVPEGGRKGSDKESNSSGKGSKIHENEKQKSLNLKDEILKLMEDSYYGDQDTESCIQKINYKNNYIYICEWNSGSGEFDIDSAIREALLKANESCAMYQLKLDLAWNRIDAAKSEIFNDCNKLSTSNLDDNMLFAIRLDRVDFVELLLDNGVILKKFLTIERLEKLYNNVSSTSILKDLLSKMRRVENDKDLMEELLRKCIQYFQKDNNNILMDVNQLIQDLLHDDQFQLYSNTTNTRDTPADAGECDKVCKEQYKPGLANVKMPEKKPDSEKPRQENPCLDLLIWSVLNNRQDMAKLFWRRGKDAIATALLAHSMFSAMLHETDERELKEQIDKNKSEFLDCAIGVLQECDRTNDGEAQCLLIRQLSDWWNTSCVIIAVQANNKEFIFHDACQDLFQSIWMGRMTQENGTLRLLICIAIPLLIPLLVKFKGKTDGLKLFPENQKSKQSTHRENTNTSDRQEKKQKKGDTTKENGNNLSIRKKVSTFYKAPVVIFFHNVISFIIFLGLYSYILISKLEEDMSVEEIILIVWVFTVLTQEIREVFSTTSLTLKTKLRSYITDGWNILDAITILLFVIGMILRSIDDPQTLEAARIFLGVNLVTFFLRLLHICSVHKDLGPKLVMIIRMVKNLTYFLVILMIFIVAYAIASHAILYPHTELSLDTLVHIFRRPYWNIFGDLMLEEVEGDEDCTNEAELYRNGTYSRCPTVSGKYFVPVLMGVYMLMCNILLLNLLIAILSNTFQMVHDKTDMHWCFQRYSLINEYYIRPSLPPPLILFSHVYHLIGFIKRKCCSDPGRKAQRKKSLDKNDTGKNAFLKRFKKKRVHELCRFEDAMANSFHHKMKLPDQESIKYRLDQLMYKMDKLRARSKKLEKRMDHMDKQLQVSREHDGLQ